MSNSQKCDICGELFINTHGVSVHKAQVHGPNMKTCKQCKSKFRSPPTSSRVSCDECVEKNGPYHDHTGENNPMYGADRSGEFEGENNPMYGVTGKDHPMWDRENKHTEETKEKLSQIQMGKTSPMKGRKYPEAGKTKLSKALSGENNPRFKGWASREDYPVGWNNDLKEFIRQLYYRTCQLCGIDELECDRKLDVHHWDSDKKNIKHSNLYPFCRSCHQIMEASQWS